jgi:hypothetical protein
VGLLFGAADSRVCQLDGILELVSIVLALDNLTKVSLAQNSCLREFLLKP